MIIILIASATKACVPAHFVRSGVRAFSSLSGAHESDNLKSYEF